MAGVEFWIARFSLAGYFLDDCAVQTWVARGAGITPRRTQLALVDREFVYSTEGDYTGLLTLEDVTATIEDRLAEVPKWVRRFRKVLRNGEPAIATGAHCSTPYDCPFIDHCQQFCLLYTSPSPRD